MSHPPPLPVPIAVLTLNPAVDMTYEIDRLLPDQKVHASATRYDPGGNGINVARGLKRLGVPTHSFCVLAGEIGNLLERLLRQQIDTLTFERVDGETRINGTAIEHHSGAQYEISGLGPAIPDDQLQRLLQTFVASTGSGFGVITGSIQPQLPRTLYAELVDRLHAQGARAVVDAKGQLLRHAVAARPFLVKPNHYELEELAGHPIDGIEQVAEAARALQHQGVSQVCVSLGPQGVVFADADNSYHATSPSVDVNATVGAGDSLVAGLVAGFSRGQPVVDTLRLAVACGAGTVRHPGTELFDAAELPALMERVTLRTLGI